MENSLGADGKPVYKRTTVETLATYVAQALGNSSAENPLVEGEKNMNLVLDYPENNPLSLRNYIKPVTYGSRSEVDVLSASEKTALEAGQIDWLPEGDTSGLTVVNQGGKQYQVMDGENVLYRFVGDGIELVSGTPVSKTFTGLEGNYKITNLWPANPVKTKLFANGKSVKLNDIVSPDENGTIRFTLKVADGVDAPNEAGNEIKLAVIHLTPSHPLGIIPSHIITGIKRNAIQNGILKERRRDHIHITFITVYCYNCSIFYY